MFCVSAVQCNENSFMFCLQNFSFLIGSSPQYLLIQIVSSGDDDCIESMEMISIKFEDIFYIRGMNFLTTAPIPTPNMLTKLGRCVCN